MSFNLDFNLEYGSSIILKKKKGNKVIEFSRHNDKILDNIVEMWKYDGKKSNKGKSTWLILKDLPVFLETYMNTGEYEFMNSGTNHNKNNKKQ
jgi:hypothetical protein